MSSGSRNLCCECGVRMESQDSGLYVVADSFCSSCLPKGFDALLRFNNQSDSLKIPEVPVYSSRGGLEIASHDPTLSLTPDNLSEHEHLPSGSQSQGRPERASQQINPELSELAAKDKFYELDDFYHTPGLEWDPDCLIVPAEEAVDAPIHGLAACETGPQCFNCGSPVGWDEATGRLEDCEVCFCPN